MISLITFRREELGAALSRRDQLWRDRAHGVDDVLELRRVVLDEYVPEEGIRRGHFKNLARAQVRFSLRRKMRRLGLPHQTTQVPDLCGRAPVRAKNNLGRPKISGLYTVREVLAFSLVIRCEQ